MGDRPSTRDLMFALFDTINGSDLDDELGGWWRSEYVGDNMWRVAFKIPGPGDDIFAYKEVAAWEVSLKVKPIPVADLDNPQSKDRWPIPGRLSIPNSPPKLTDDQVREAREQHAAGVSERKLARQYGVSNTAMHKLLVGESYGWVQ
jgi:hypothetical protein